MARERLETTSSSAWAGPKGMCLLECCEVVGGRLIVPGDELLRDRRVREANAGGSFQVQH